MTRRELALTWLTSFAYTGYVVVLVFLLAAYLPEAWAAILGLAFSAGPIIAWSFWMLRD